MNILKTFEIFLREPLSVLKESFVQIVNISSPYIENSSVTASLMNNKTQITVVNSDKMYNLLKTVQNKKMKRAARALQLQPTNHRKVVFGQLTMHS